MFPPKVGNIYFVGNAVGALDPFLGFGQFNSIATGVLAARSMVKGSDFQKSIKDIVHRNIQMYEFRKIFNGLNNQSYDRIIRSIGLPGVKRLVYDTNINVIKHGANVLRLFCTKSKK